MNYKIFNLCLKEKKFYEQIIKFSKKRYKTEDEGKELDDNYFQFYPFSKTHSKINTQALLKDEKELKKINENTIQVNTQNTLNSFFNKMYTLQIKPTKYVITKSLTREISDYKKITQKSSCHIILAQQMRERGVDVQVSSKIEYLFSTKCRFVKHFLQWEKAVDYDYFKIKKGIRIDHTFYIEKQLQKPIDQFINVSLGIEGSKGYVFEQLQYRKNKELCLRQLQTLSMGLFVYDKDIE